LASRVEFDDDWETKVGAKVEEFLDGRLGPDIAADARRYCPKSARTQGRETAGQLRYHSGYRREADTSPGSLAESIEHHISDGGALIVAATGNDEREYAVYVELGHRVFHPSTRVTGPEVVPPEPFLRPALYQQRGE